MDILNKIVSYLRENKIEDTYNLIKQYEAKYVENGEYWNLKGLLCLKVNEYLTAIDCFESAIDLAPCNSDYYYNCAYSYEKVGNFSDAALYYGLAYRYSCNNEFQDELLSIHSNNNTLKKIFNEAAFGKKKNYIILSSCGWGDVLQRMHHIARSLVKFGHEVMYVTPSNNFSGSNENITVSELTDYSIRTMKIVDGVKVFTPISLSYNQKVVKNNYVELVQQLLNSSSDNRNIIITYMPYQINVIDQLKGDFFHIYECVDDHSDVEYAFWGQIKDTIWEQQLMNKADFITTTATSLYLQRVAIENRNNVFLSRNAVNEGDFIRDSSVIPQDLKAIPEPRIVYSGAIYEWFDMELFYQVVKSNPDKSFVIIGFGKHELFKEKYDNLYFLGPKKHCELKYYLSHMQIGIIPFKANTDLIINCDAIKHYEYIACNLPVITTYMPEAAMGKINTFLADTKEDFNHAIEKCLNYNTNFLDIKQFIVDNSWNERAALLSRIPDGLSDNEIKLNKKKMGLQIEELSKYYNSPVFKTLKAVYTKIEDNVKFEKYTKQAFIESENKYRYIEKQYLTALYINKNIKVFVEVVSNSSNIRKEVRDELIYRIKKNDYDCIQAISLLCVGDFQSYINITNKFAKKSISLLYKLFLEYILEKNISEYDLETLLNFDQKSSPLYNFLEKEIKNNLQTEQVLKLNKNKKIVSIIGYFGEGNTGDEALLTSLINRLKGITTVQPVVIAFNHSKDISDKYDIPSVEIRKFEEVCSLIRESELVVLGPGGLIEDYAQLDAKHFFVPLGMYNYLYPVIIAQLYGISVIGYGLGIGPLLMDESKNAIKLAFGGMEKIYVRDKKSFEILEEIGVENVKISGDAVINLEPKNNKNIESKIKKDISSGGFLGISIRPFINIDTNKLLNELSVLLSYLTVHSNMNFILLPMQKDYDLPLLNELYNKAMILSPMIKDRIYIVKEEIAPEEMMGLIGSLDMMVGMRLHSLIFATVTKVPSIALSYDPKVDEFVRSMGMEDYLMDAKNLNSEALVKLFKRRMNDKELNYKIEKNLKQSQELENESWDYIFNKLI